MLLERGLVRGAADLYELTRGATARARRLRRDLGEAADRGDRRLARAAVLARALRDRHRGGRRGHRAQPRGAVPPDRPPAGRDAGGDRSDPGRRPEDGGDDRRAARRARRARADRGACARPGCASRRKGRRPARGRSPASRFVLTGTLPTLTREAATELILRAGGRVTSRSPRRPTTSSPARAPGSKLEKAERLGVAVIDEAGLLALLDDRLSLASASASPSCPARAGRR